jgi:hypothetical protein
VITDFMNHMLIILNNVQIDRLLLMNIKCSFEDLNHQRLLTLIVAKLLDGDLSKLIQNFWMNHAIQIIVDGFDEEVS